MRLGEFITSNMEQILVEWEAFARTLGPESETLSTSELRDHAERILRAIAADIETPQTPLEQIRKSHGEAPSDEPLGPAKKHGDDRYDQRFTLLQMTSEFRALRASVLRLWSHQAEGTLKQHLGEVTRFNEAVDQVLAQSIQRFSERAENTRDMFDAILGHDLRGPLASVGFAAKMLGRADMNADKVAAIGAGLERTARVMTAMVDDLLSFASTKLGNGLPIHRTQVDIAAVCEDAIADTRAMHPGCKIELQTDGRLDAQLDASRMHQLLVNLMGNACQHGMEGRPIYCTAHGNDEEVVFRVVNEGKQISKVDLERMFRPFVQLAAEGKSKETPGNSLGLGLHIACEIAVGHGGSINATSSSERNEFTVHFPRDAQA